jgi:membrane-associated phospholipid phosphatase
MRTLKLRVRSLSPAERLDLSPGVIPAALAIFALIGVASRAGVTRRWDLRVRRKIHPKENKRLTRVASMVSLIGAPRMRPILAGSLAVACAIKGAGNPSRIIAAALLATGVNKTSRLVLHQRRPPGAGVHHGLDVYAYPSGHCCAVAAIMTATVREMSKGQAGHARSRMAAAGVLVSLATAWSRLYLDEHWIDDVIGGLSAGLGVGLMVTDA